MTLLDSSRDRNSTSVENSRSKGPNEPLGQYQRAMRQPELEVCERRAHRDPWIQLQRAPVYK